MTDATVPDAVPSGGSGPHWIDAHCHLQPQFFDADGSVAQSATEAAAAGVVGMVCVGTDLRTSTGTLSVARQVRAVGLGCWVTMGIHPHQAADGTEEIAQAARAARSSGEPIVAIGECGLDYHYNHADPAQQRRAFAAQIALATELDLALVIHTRAAWDDTLQILTAEGPPRRIVVHCFTGGPDEARRCLDLGAYLSFSGIATFKNAADVRAAAALCPEDRLLVETDAPFLAPVPYRGQTNRPAWVSVVGHAIAEVRAVPPSQLSTTTMAATRKVFQLS